MNILGRKVVIKCDPYIGEWGTVMCFDGAYYHIALWDGPEWLIFERNEFTVRR